MDPDRLEAMSLAARRTAQNGFCSTRIIPHYEHFYERVLVDDVG